MLSQSHLLLSLLTATLAGISLPNVAALKVMMIGNSYTNPVFPLVRSMLEEVYTNNNGTTSSVSAKTSGGAQLNGWATDQGLKNSLTDTDATDYQRYDLVVLQDQSQVAGFHGIMSNFQEARVDPVIVIDSLVRENGANTILYMTWGRKNGDPMNPSFYPNFKTMNQRLKEGYILYRDAISTPERPVLIAPVGMAFEAIYDSVIIEEEGIDPINAPSVENQFTKLYNGDGSHPSNVGAYLSACVLVGSMTGEDPREWAWKPNSMSEEERDSMQEFAWRAIQDFANEQHIAVPNPAEVSSAPTSSPTSQPTSIRSTEANKYGSDGDVGTNSTSNTTIHTTISSNVIEITEVPTPAAQPSEESSKADHAPTSSPVIDEGTTDSPATQHQSEDTTNSMETDTSQSGVSNGGRNLVLDVGIIFLPMLPLII